MTEGRPRLRVFVYGTLKKGQRNHDRYCRGSSGNEPATVRGYLYDLLHGHPALGLGYGYPALVVPDEDVLAHGTKDYAGDTNACELPTGGKRGRTDPVVHGEILTFDDPEERLPALDALEGYVPGGPGPYRRVLVPAAPDRAGVPGVAAWTYAVEKATGTYLPGGRWPAPS